MARVKHVLTVLLALVGVSFVAHYALFGSFPVGEPQLVEDHSNDPEAAVQ